MKKLVLASAAALVLAGAVAGTGTVSANSYNNWNLTPEQRAKKLRELKLSRSKRSLVLSELERKRKSMVENLTTGFSDLTVSEKREFITLVKRAYSSEEIDRIHKEAVEKVIAKTNLYHQYAQLLRKGYKDDVEIDQSKLPLYEYQNLKEIIRHLKK